MEIKKNDWVATLFFNQDKSLQELADLGFTVSNSDIKDASYYKSKPEIQQAFVNDKGEFDNVKFNNFYNSAIQLYNDEDVKSLQTDLLNSYEYDPDDLLAPIGSKTYYKPTEIVHYANPMRQSRGIKNLNQMGDPTMSEREVAQTNKIFNPETGEFENETPNDLNLWDMVTGKSLVMASWDEDGYHEVNGRMIPHRKGELKYNEEGDPYYEYLNGRSLAGKDMLHASDILTVDGSNWNKYDFFDSDGLDKSASGVIAKTLAKIAPSFIPYVGGFYAFTGAAMELGKLLPELYKSIEGIVTNDSSNNEIANSVGAWFHRFDSSASDKSRNKPLSFENIGNMVSSSSLQLIQQRLISKIPAMINSGKYTENTIKWGRALSLSYMAGTSSTDTFEAFKEAGTSDRVAGLGAIASMMAMKKLMDNDYFRDFWYKGTPLARSEFKNAIKSAANEVQKSIDVGTITKSAKNQKKFIDKTIDTIVNTFNRITSKAIISSALNEGIEETAEEVSFDTIKGIASALNGLGLLDKNSDYDFGFSFKSMISKYATSFIGGAIGGTTFHLHDSFQNFINGTTEDVAKKEGFQELIYLIRNNRTGELKRELSRWHQKGMLGSTNLSGVDGTFDKNDENWGFVYSAAKEGESQNDIIYRQISNIIDRVEGILDEENLKFTDEQLSEFKIVNELEHMYDDEASIALKAHISNQISKKLEDNNGIISGIFQDWNTLSNSLVSTKIELEELLKPDETSAKTPSDIDAHFAAVKKSSRYKYVSEKLKSLRERRDSLIKGERNSYYTGQLNFSLQPKLAESFGAIVGKNQFSLNTTGKKYEDLLQEDKQKVDDLYSEYQAEEKKNVFKAYDIFYHLVDNYKDQLNKTAERVEKYSDLFNANETEYITKLKSLSQDEYVTRSLLDDELKKENPDEDLIQKYNLELTEIAKEHKNIISDPKIQTLRSLSEKGSSLLLRTDDETEFSLAAKSYLQWLEYLVNNDLFLEPEDTDLNNILNKIADTISSNFNDNKLLEKSINSYYYNIIKGLIDEAVVLLKKGDISKAFSKLDSALFSFDQQKENLDVIYPGEEYEESLYNIRAQEVENEFNAIVNPNFYGLSLMDFLSKVIELKSKLKPSPVYDLLNDILSDIDPKLNNLVNYILSDLKKIPKLENLDDYVSAIPNALDNLKKIRKVLPIIYEIMHHNDIIPYNNDGSKVIGDNSSKILLNELGSIYTKVNRLINIIEASGKKKLVEQERIMLNMRVKFANVLIGDLTVTDKLSKILDFDLKEEAKKLGINISEVTLDNYNEFENKIILLETKIYSAAKNKNFSVQEIVDNIFSIFDKKSIINRIPTKISSDPESVVHDYDKLMYILSLVAFPSSNFYNKYSGVIKSMDLAPLFSQEYLVKIVYSFSQDVDLLNTILSKIGSLIKLNEKSDNSDKYLAGKGHLKNILPLISGGAGTGKTFGVDGILYNMLKNDYDIITTSKVQQQVDNLNTNIGHTGKSKTLDNLIRDIIGRDLNPSKDFNHVNGKFILTDNIKISKDNIFGSKGKKMLFLDEYSLFSSVQLELISKWASNNDILLVFSGDYKQSKANILWEGKYKQSGIEDWNTIYTPELTTSIRVGNAAKNHNYELLRTILTEIYDYYFEHPELTREQLSEKLSLIISKYGIDFKYFEKDNIFAGGERFVNKGDIPKYIDEIKSRSNDYCIIYDDKTAYKYKDIDESHKRHRNSVQGQEYEYIIIDYDISKNVDGVLQGSMGATEEIYAITQRSKEGTIFSNEGIHVFKSASSHNDPLSANKLEMNKDQIMRFKEKRMKTFEAKIEDVDLFDWRIDNVNSEVKDEDLDNNKAESPFIEDTRNEAEESKEQKTQSAETEISLPPVPPIDDVYLVDEFENKPIENVSQQKTNVRHRLTTLNINDNIVNEYFNVINNKEEKYYYLSSLFKYGHYKNLDNIDYSSIPKEIKVFIQGIEEAKVIYKTYNNSIYICGVVKRSGEELTVPLFKTSLVNKINDSVVEYEISMLYKVGKRRKNNNEIDYITDENGLLSSKKYKIYPMPVIFHDENNSEGYTVNQNDSDDYYIRSEGKTFAIISTDPFATDDDFNLYLTPEDYSKGQFVTDVKKITQIGAKQYVDSFEDLQKISKKTKRNIKTGMQDPIHPYIVYDTTIGKILKHLDNEYLNRILIEKESNGLEYKLYIGDIKNISDNSKFYTAREFKDIKYNGEPVYVVRFYKGNRRGYLNPAEVINMIDVNEGKKAINSDAQFKLGIMVNDIKSYGGRVTEGSYYYTVEDKNNVIKYAIDVDIHEPTFVLSEIIEESSEENINDNKISEVSEPVKEDIDVKDAIKNKFNEYNIIDIIYFDDINEQYDDIKNAEYSGERNINYQLFLVYLQKEGDKFPKEIFVYSQKKSDGSFIISDLKACEELTEVINSTDINTIGLINNLLYDNSGIYDIEYDQLWLDLVGEC